MDRDINVAMLVLDSVRADHCSTYGYERETTPEISKLATESYLFENAYSPRSWTVPAHGSIFTGRLPTEHGAHANHKRLDWDPDDTLAGQLQARGYNTACLGGNPWLTEEFGFGGGFDRVDFIRSELPFDGAGDPREMNWDGGPLKKVAQAARWLADGNPLMRVINSLSLAFSDWSFLRGEHLTNTAIDWVDDREDNSPFFLFANYMDAHEPYRLEAPYDHFLDETESATLDVNWNLESIRSPPENKRALTVDSYDSALHYLDRCVGEFIDELTARNLLEDTVLVVLSDHGQCLGEQNYWGHGTYLYDELLHVPMLIRPPGGLGGPERVSRMTSLAAVKDIVRDLVDEAFDPADIDAVTSDDAGPVACAESMGRHQDVEIPPDRYSTAGYRALHLQDVAGIHNLEDDTFDIRPSGKDDDQESRLRSIENEIFSRLTPHVTIEEEGKMDERTQRRLENLGYI